MCEIVYATLHCFEFESKRDPEYIKLHKKLINLGLDRQHSWSGNIHNDFNFYHKKIVPLDGKLVPLETKFLFNNQWNTAPVSTSDTGLRVFDWHEQYIPESKKVSGYWLSLSKDAILIRESTYACGYCGFQTREQTIIDGGFCLNCLESPYLKEKDLDLLRLRPISSKAKRPELSEEEKSWLIPYYIEAQTKIKEQQARKKLETLEKEKKEKIELAEMEYHGFLWLIHNKINTENVIFYSHTRTFSFGWRSNGIDKSIEQTLRQALKEFPFKYEIKTKEVENDG